MTDSTTTPRSAAGNSDVFLFANLKKDYQDKEYYYEEFCYKQMHQKEHNSKGASLSLIHI